MLGAALLEGNRKIRCVDSRYWGYIGVILGLY